MESKTKTSWEYPEGTFYLGDCLQVMKTLPDDYVDIVCGSPPYEEARDYLEDGEDLGIARPTEEWCAWMVDVFKECLRVCKGLVALVVGHGKGAKRWSGAPALLCADLIRGGIPLRSPLWYKRVSSPGAGGNEWLRPDLEWIICASKTDDLPYSNVTACGHPPKYGKGGAMSRRQRDGKRIDGRPVELRTFERCNPGNIIEAKGGGGHLGSELAHENEAPYPVEIPNFIIKSFTRPGDTVMDCFSGSGTTAACAVQLGRKFVAIDLRPSQIKLGQKRLVEARLNKGFGIG